MGYVIGADVGTQSVKAVLVDDQGTVLGASGSACDATYPTGGWAEQDPRDWERALARSVHELLQRTGSAGRDVTMLAVASQVDGLVALDNDLRPLRPAIIWLDRRATRQSERLRDAVGEDALTERTGLNPDASHIAPKAMWLRDEEPGTYRATRWLASVGAHLNGWLAGEVVQDHANASSSLLYDLCSGSWSDELVAHAGLEKTRLPAIRSGCGVIGPLRSGPAEELGLSTRCQIVVGTGDDHAAALGAGAVAEGIMVDVTGTAEPVAVPSREAVRDALRLVETHAHAVEDLLLVENPGFVSGGSVGWWSRMEGIPQPELFEHAALAPPGSEGALFLPALSGSTAPRWNERMRGCFAGLGLHHGRAHLARAVLEGCAFALRDIVDRLAALGLGGDELRVVGGGTRSPLWLQIKADVTGRTVRAVRGENATAAGAAMLAAVAARSFADLPEAAARMVQLAPDPVVPRAAAAERYEEGYRAYRRLFDAVELALP